MGRRRAENPYVEYFREHTDAADSSEMDPDLVGLSVTFGSAGHPRADAREG